MSAAKKSSEVSGLVISTVNGMCQLIAKMEMNKIVQKQYQSKFKRLHKLLSEIQCQLLKYPKIQKATKIIEELKNVEEALQQALNECDKLSETRTHSHQDNTELQLRNLESLLEQAETSAEDAIELIHVFECPLVVTEVVAVPDGQCLNISWRIAKKMLIER
jgi:phosphoglycerate-specific signal transduction histidine kinase